MHFLEQAHEEDMNKLKPTSYLKKITRFYLFITLIIFSSTHKSFADNQSSTEQRDKNDCRAQAADYLDEVKPKKISEHCFDDYLAAASLNSVKKAEDGSLLIFGHNNILFIQKTLTPSSESASPKIEKHIIAGKHTLLKEITALTLDSSNQDIVVLDGLHGLALPFSLKFFGNVSPRRTLKNNLLIGATGIAVDPIHHELIFSNNSKQNIQVFSRLADIDGHRPSNHTALLRSIEGSLTQITSAQSIAIDTEHDEIFLLDKDSNQILIFDRSSVGNTPPKRIIRGNATLLSSPTSINYVQSNDTLEVANGDKTTLIYPRATAGEIVPTTPTNQK
jgi:hypothetical protein